MKVVVSTSSPITNVALFDPYGVLVGAKKLESKYNSSGAALSSLRDLLCENGLEMHALTTLVADLGPGSFTGSKVAVTIVKILGMALQLEVCGVSSFDLIDCRATVYVPSRKGEFFVRVPGEKPFVSRGVPNHAVGYGMEGREDRYPEASRLCSRCSVVQSSPELLVPSYIAPPSISTPKDSRVLKGNDV